MKIVVTKEFKDRTELDDFVRTRFGTNPEANATHTIEATKEELTALALSEDVNVYGVRIVESASDELVVEPIGFGK